MNVLRLPYPRDHEGDNHTQAIRDNENRSNFSKEKIRKGTFNYDP